MPSIFTKDDLRASVEAATGGKVTVLYTASGQPSYMNVIPQFNLEDIDPSLGKGVHPAFIVGGVEKSELFIGTYQGIIKNGEMLSLPGVEPSGSRNIEQMTAFARANGPGWHCVTNTEYAALALWCWKNGFLPNGNSNWGRSGDASWETARRSDGSKPGDQVSSGKTLTGSGPVSWRHDNTPAGISDLHGNIWAWTPGFRSINGELQIVANNDAAMNHIDLGVNSAAWKAIDGETGQLITPTYSGSLANNDYVPTTPRSVRIARSGTDAYTLVRTNSGFDGLSNPGTPPVSDAALAVLKQYCLFPIVKGVFGNHGLWTNLEGEAMVMRGGSFSYLNSGLFALYMSYARNYASSNIGARPAFFI
ncbi:hypothetical protein [Alcaligenes faecalis]|uniref:hypothetical protein n=1 Tax=Alcaligenes faecalis TaxID=511 RepID=UPI000E1638DC|nr:hypothetical protein [Alcaligenes faecalis]SSY76709.1 Uncharacterised protein [Alcaligenes faecalis subsp. faecalis]